METSIRVENLSKYFDVQSGRVSALENISFEVEKGDIFGIIGLSGAGKSTLVRCLNLLEAPTEGRVIVEGRSLLELPKDELRLARRDIGMIFQGFNLLMQRNVLDNVCFPMEIAKVKREEAKKKAMELLETVGLAEKAKAYPATLSGGQKQRVAIARVLASSPRVLLCDEATSALDPQTTKSILELLKKINREYGITIVIITHEMAVVQEICNHVLVLEHGHLMETGTVEELFQHPKTDAARKLLVNAGTSIPRMHRGRRIRLTFSTQSAHEPIIGNAALRFKTPVNILFADTKEINGKANGQMIIQLPDDALIAAQMVEYFEEKGLQPEDWKDVQ